MIINHQRQKLINAIIYFANNTRYFHKIKMFKLLYFLDFEHYKQTGRSVTGLYYYAWPKGPVPVELFEEVKNPQADIEEHLQFNEAPLKKGSMLNVKVLSEFKSEYFSKRELKILQSLANEYCNTAADDMIEATHLENQPWHKIYHLQKQQQQLIPYELAIRSQEFDDVQQLKIARDELINNLG